MRLLTINTHSLIEENYSQKLDAFVKGISKLKPDIIAMQEVNQTSTADSIDGAKTLVMANSYPIKRDNHALSVCAKLYISGLTYHFIWLGIKKGYDKFDEGIAILSRKPIEEKKSILLSGTDDVMNFKKRMALGVKVNENWFYSVHTGRFDDTEEPFAGQWKKLNASVKNKKNVWLMGDFNCPAAAKNEGYDLILSTGWSDTYLMALKKDKGITVPNTIDGWRDTKAIDNGSRIDYIFTNSPKVIKSSRIVFDGTDFPVISDHFGILAEV